MATATNIITYIGVPLVVLRVMPICYTFLSALYSKYRARRFFDLATLTSRTRLMAGVVEVDLPQFHLTPLMREDSRY